MRLLAWSSAVTTAAELRSISRISPQKLTARVASGRFEAIYSNRPLCWGAACATTPTRIGQTDRLRQLGPPPPESGGGCTLGGTCRQGSGAGQGR